MELYRVQNVVECKFHGNKSHNHMRFCHAYLPLLSEYEKSRRTPSLIDFHYKPRIQPTESTSYI